VTADMSTQFTTASISMSAKSHKSEIVHSE